MNAERIEDRETPEIAWSGRDYDHDLAGHFSAAQVRAIYAANPGWAEIERRVYGDLIEL